MLGNGQEKRRQSKCHAEKNESRKGIWSPVLEEFLHIYGTQKEGSLRWPV